MVLEAGFHSIVQDLHSDHVAELRPVLLLLQAGALFLLLIGTVNLANLFMVRATSRTKEYSLRRVLGAGRAQIARMLVVEALLLSGAGGLLGIGLAAGALRGIPALAGDLLPVDLTPRIDFSTGLAALGMSASLGLLLAMPVIWLAVHGDLAAALTVESRGGTTTRRVHRLRHALIVAQIALAFVLLSGAGLLGLSFSRVLKVQPGFQLENRLTGAVTLPLDQYKEPKQRIALIERLHALLRSLPGVSSAAISTGVPFSGREQPDRVGGRGDTAACGSVHPGRVVQRLGLRRLFRDAWRAAARGPPPKRRRRSVGAKRVCGGRGVCPSVLAPRRRARPPAGAPRQSQKSPRAYVTIVGVVGSVKQDDLADIANSWRGLFSHCSPGREPRPLRNSW